MSPTGSAKRTRCTTNSTARRAGSPRAARRVYLFEFPYTDLSGSKTRPVCIVSSAAFNAGPDVVVAMITSRPQRLDEPGIGDVVLADWQAAGLLRPSVLRAGRLWTAERGLLRGQRGTLTGRDLVAMREARDAVLG